MKGIYDKYLALATEVSALHQAVDSLTRDGRSSLSMLITMPNLSKRSYATVVTNWTARSSEATRNSPMQFSSTQPSRGSKSNASHA